MGKVFRILNDAKGLSMSELKQVSEKFGKERKTEILYQSVLIEPEEEEEELVYNRQDFWVTTSNKQLNFVQHIRSMLKTTGKAAVLVRLDNGYSVPIMIYCE